MSLLQGSPKHNESKIDSDSRAWLLFWLGMGLYLITRGVALDKFPIYFFSDEAIQTMSAFDLINRGFRDLQGNLFPVYFENGQQFNLSFSVWLQVLIAWLPRSVWLTRGLPALVSLVFPLSLGLWAKDFFKSKLWWLMPLIVSAFPAWFLHSRTAFETSLGVSFFSLFLLFYLRYREQNRRWLPAALFFGALAFYSYAPLQLVVGVTGFVLLIVDWRYHYQYKRWLPLGAFTLILLALPYLWFRYTHQQALGTQLHLLRSYWLSEIPFWQKLGIFAKKWLQGLDPRYWFLANPTDLIRHQMKGFGHLPWFFFPAFIVGLGVAIRRIRQTPYRLCFIAFLVAPMGAALVDVSITRVLVMVFALALLIFIGFDSALGSLKNPSRLQAVAKVGLALALALFSVWICVDAVRNGALWYPDYGLYGMQWGGEQISERVIRKLEDEPQTQLVLSPTWANNTDIIMRYFLGDPLPIKIGSTMEYDLYFQELSPEQIFIIGPEEYDWLIKNPKFTDVTVVDSLAWPDGRTGFHFVSFRYSEQAPDIFEQELAERRKPQETAFDLLGQRVWISFSRLDLGTIAHIFDGNEATPLRTLEANPLEVMIDFPQPIDLSSVEAWVGSPATRLSVALTLEDGRKVMFDETVPSSNVVRPVEIEFGESLSVEQLQVWVESLGEDGPTHVHLWELILK